MKEPVVVLGGGPAGVGAALMLARSGKAAVKVLERAPRVGGNSGSFLLEGVHCDFGSHRLHPSTEPHLMAMIKEAVGPDLLWRPRHGRIRLKGRWIHFPLKPVDLLLRLPKGFTVQLLWDAATKPFRRADFRQRSPSGPRARNVREFLLSLHAQALGTAA